MSKLGVGFILFFVIMYSLGVVAQATPELILPAHCEGGIKLNISTLSDKMGATFSYDYLAAFVENEAKDYTSNKAIQGRHTQEGNYLIFTPYYPFENGMTYVVRTKSTNAPAFYYERFQLEKKKTVANAKLLSIYPSATELPENLLRFYIYFNTPMKKGEALKHIQLIDAAGNIDTHVFMKFKQELWSGDGKRLTVLFDPGRIKRGVSTNRRLGPALEEGKQYYLSISAAWRDVYGQQLSATITKEIKVVKAYRHKIKIKESLCLN